MNEIALVIEAVENGPRGHLHWREYDARDWRRYLNGGFPKPAHVLWSGSEDFDSVADAVAGYRAVAGRIPDFIWHLRPSDLRYKPVALPTVDLGRPNAHEWVPRQARELHDAWRKAQDLDEQPMPPVWHLIATAARLVLAARSEPDAAPSPQNLVAAMRAVHAASGAPRSPKAAWDAAAACAVSWLTEPARRQRAP